MNCHVFLLIVLCFFSPVMHACDFLQQFRGHIRDLYDAVKKGCDKKEIESLLERGRHYESIMQRKTTKAGQYEEAIRYALNIGDAQTTKLLVERWCEVKGNFCARHYYVVPVLTFLITGMLMTIGYASKYGWAEL